MSANDSVSERPSHRKKRWSELSSGQRASIILGGIAELILTTIAFRDLKQRPASQVRGPKALWALAFSVQPFGPILYLLGGRREAR
jgi:hypothetical protein